MNRLFIRGVLAVCLLIILISIGAEMISAKSTIENLVGGAVLTITGLCILNMPKFFTFKFNKKKRR